MNLELSTARRGYRWLLWVVAVLVLAADQWSKARIIDTLAIGETWRPLVGTPILESFAFTHTKNSGAAFGILQTGGWFFIIVAAVVSVLIAWYVPRLPSHQWWLFLSLGLVQGGAVGNLVDRLRIGWVTDFIHIGDFAIFNVADSAVVCGVTILFVHFWREDRQQAALGEGQAGSERLDSMAERQGVSLPIEGQLATDGSDTPPDGHTPPYPDDGMAPAKPHSLGDAA